MKIHYSLGLPNPATHLYEVNVHVDEVHQSTIDLVMPVWAPGSYLIREFSRHVQKFEAVDADGALLSWHKLEKNSWRVKTAGASRITVRYQVYAYELTVRTSFLDSDFGLANLSSLLAMVSGGRDLPVTLQVQLPEGWKAAFPLDQAPGAPGTFLADNFDHLIDSPGIVGTPRLVEFEVMGVPHRLVLVNRGNETPEMLVADLQRVITTAAAMFGGLPYPHYTFFLILSDKRGGGLEHRNCQMCITYRNAFNRPRDYQGVLGLLAHEFFHVWLVKRLLPADFVPYDLVREDYTRQLWLMEGVTEYYTHLLLRRAALISVNDFLDLLARDALRCQQTPGRLLQTLEAASFDSWIKHYRTDENSVNSSISYYLKGELVGWLLDCRIRALTQGARCLDDVIRLAYERYALDGAPGLPDGAFESLAAEVAGADLSADFNRWLRTTAELDYAEALAPLGLDLLWGYEDGSSDSAALGVRVQPEAGRAVIANVLVDGPAYGADLQSGDELLALDGERVTSDALLADRLRDHHPGETVTLALFRRDLLRTVQVTLGRRPPDKATLRPIGNPSASQVKLYRSWAALD